MRKRRNVEKQKSAVRIGYKTEGMVVVIGRENDREIWVTTGPRLSATCFELSWSWLLRDRGFSSGTGATVAAEPA